MHEDALDVPPDLIAGEIALQAPGFAGLPLTPLATGGTEMRIFRLGTAHTVRVPWQVAGAPVIDKLGRWLPGLTSHLPLASPDIVAIGRATAALPLPWIIQTWLPGTDADRAPMADPLRTADALADFVSALQSRPVPEDAPKGSRGGPLGLHDARFRTGLSEVRTLDLADADAAEAIWTRGLTAPPYAGPPVWLHGDLMPANLVLQNGDLTGILDWNCMGAGDPAYDLIPAWFLFDAAARDRFRARLAPDDAMWDRARARVAWQATLALPYYRDTNPVMMRQARRGLAEAIADLGL
ncbi:MAG: phosphotransferase [Pseudomonadota bacterium]